MTRSQKIRLSALCLLVLLWALWMWESNKLAVTVFMRDDAPDTPFLLVVALLTGLWCGWRRAVRGEASAFKALAPWQLFLSVAAFVGVTLLNVPEGWVRLTAGETVQSDVTFRLTYPGPSLGRKSHCEAGLRIDDAWLGRLVMLCTHTESVPRDASSVQVEKRLAARGAWFTRYRFIAENGKTYAWQPATP